MVVGGCGEGGLVEGGNFTRLTSAPGHAVRIRVHSHARPFMGLSIASRQQASSDWLHLYWDGHSLNLKINIQYSVTGLSLI